MRFRKLRIAWSAACSLVCALLVVLWARSYWAVDEVHCPLKSPAMLIVHSFEGRLSLYAGERIPYRSGWFPSGWGRDSTSIRDVAPTRTPQTSWAFHSDIYGQYVTFPHWLPTFALGAIALLCSACLPERFSLRTLLIATTLVAMALGLAVWAAS
jgi:hypothetical protein